MRLLEKIKEERTLTFQLSPCSPWEEKSTQLLILCRVAPRGIPENGLFRRSPFPVPRSPGKNHPKIGTFWQKKTKIVAQCTKNKSLTAKASFRIDFGRKKFGLRRLKKKGKKSFFETKNLLKIGWKFWIRIYSSKSMQKWLALIKKVIKYWLKHVFVKMKKMAYFYQVS